MATDVWEKFKRFTASERMLRPGSRVLLAVSGGPDSVCLAHLFYRLKKNAGVEPVIVHFDHGLRKAAGRDARHVELLGERLGIPVVTEKIPVRAYARGNGVSLETAGRTLRYEGMARIARSRRCGLVATGHNANDNTETVLMWLIRGTGPEGLAGIPASRQMEKGIKLIRPLLSSTRAEIEAYIRRQGLTYVIDRSNFSPDFTRNRIRHKVVPLLETFNTRLVEHLFNFSRIADAENAYLEGITARRMSRSVQRKKGKIILDLKQFFGYNKIIRARIVKALLPEKRSVAQVERVLAWMCDPASRELAYSRSWRLEKKGEKLVLRNGVLRKEHQQTGKEL